jgi:hypothetical protein
MRSINIEMLMSHSIGISDSYYRPTEEELLNDYLKAISCLTISDENRLQEQVNELSEKTKDNDHVVKAKLQEKDEELKNLKEMMLSIQQEQKEMRDSLRMRNKVLDTMMTT